MSDVSEIELVRLDLIDIVGNCRGGAELKMMSKSEEGIELV